MKNKILLGILTFLTISNSQAQRVLLSGDTTIQIALDSTGYAEVHPHDISEDAGIFIYSKDGREALRIYGSFRLLAVYDNKNNFHPYDLTQPTIPTGSVDFYYPNSIWNINMSRLGFDALIGSHKLDDMSGLLFSTELYRYMGRRIADIGQNLCNGRVLSILEGGYHLPSLAASVGEYCRGLIEYQQ